MATGERVGKGRQPFRRRREQRSERLTLSEVDRRRTELWTISIFVVVAITIAIALYTLAGDLVPEALRIDFDFSNWIVVVLVAGLALAFLIYVLEKERELRRITGLLIEERVLSAALSNRLAEISRLSELGKAVNTILDLDDVLNLIISSALELLGGTEGSIMLFDEERENLIVVSYQGPRYEVVLGRSTHIGDPIAGLVAKRKEPMLMQGEEPASIVGKAPPRMEGHTIYSSVCVPLMRQDELIGVLNLNETVGQRSFTEQDLAALQFFAEHAAIAIGNARLYAKERESVVRLEELDRLKSDFVATISHELKTPLTAIIGAAKTVARKGGAMKPEHHNSFMDMIDRQGNRLLRLIEDVLVAARIESGGRVLRRELVDLREIAQEVMTEVAQTHPERSGDLILRSEPEHPSCWGDMTAILQIVSNLVDNACKYSEEGSKIIVEVRASPDEAVIEVADHGQGIEPKQFESIFERFRQADSSASRPVGGVGLGLYIVKSLVESHGGTISADSEPGAGSTFTVRLPQRKAERDASGEPEEA